MNAEQTLQRLSDRASISDVLTAFAYHLDHKQWSAWIELFADNGVLALPMVTKDKQTLQADGGPIGLMSMHATHDLSSNHRIDVDGDTARANSYVQATHVVEAGAVDSQWVLGGWYDTTFQRTPAGWKIARTTLTRIWS